MIVVGGESLVDLVPTSHGRLMDPTLGGGPYNVAIAASRLGATTSFLSRLSTDAFGAELMDRLRDSRVHTDLVQRGDEPTTLAVVGFDEARVASYSFYVQGTADRLFTDPGPLPPETTAVSLGTLSLVLEPGASAYERVLYREAARGTLTVLDPNIRAQLIEDPHAYRERFHSWLPSVGVLKVSEDDAGWLADGPVDEALQKWRTAGPAAIVLTRGADGIEVLTRAGERAAVSSVPVAVADTIGAGDTVHGALLAWLEGRGVRSRDDLAGLGAGGWRDALQYAGKAAAVTVSRSGAEPPYAAEIV